MNLTVLEPGLWSWNSNFGLHLRASKFFGSVSRTIWSIENWKPLYYISHRPIDAISSRKLPSTEPHTIHIFSHSVGFCWRERNCVFPLLRRRQRYRVLQWNVVWLTKTHFCANQTVFHFSYSIYLQKALRPFQRHLETFCCHWSFRISAQSGVCRSVLSPKTRLTQCWMWIYWFCA